MGGGRARAALAAGAILASAVLGAGCGESRHPNEQRPQVSTRVSVTVTDKALIVQPTKLGAGPDKTQQITQNEGQPQGEIKHSKAPLAVTFVVANQTGHELALNVRGGNAEVESRRIAPRSPETFGAELPTGTYTVTTKGFSPASGPAEITVGTYRASSQNDLLLP